MTTPKTETTVTDNVKTPTDVTTEKASESTSKNDENTIPSGTTEQPTTKTSVTTTQKPNTKPGCDPHCSMPSTWETTAIGETRDFIQILRERYGDRVKILRDTTHYPKNPTYARKRLAFIPGHHMERQKYYRY